MVVDVFVINIDVFYAAFIELVEKTNILKLTFFSTKKIIL